MTDSREISTEILSRITADIEHFGGTLPEKAAIAWRGYLAAMLEWDLISVAEYDGLTADLPPVPDDPAVGILLGRDAPTTASDADRQSSPSIGRTAGSAASRS